MIHDDLAKTIADLGFQEMKEIFYFEKKGGNWAYLRLRQPEFNCQQTAEITLIWEMIAVSADGPVSELEQISLSVLLSAGCENEVTTEIRKTWKPEELKDLPSGRPVKRAMLQYLAQYGPISFPSFETLLNLSP